METVNARPRSQHTYSMVIIGGQARLTRPSTHKVVSPTATPARSMEWKPGMILARKVPALVFP